MDATPATQISFSGSLNLLDLDQLTNDPIAHNDDWEDMPHKLPSYLPMFEGKLKEYPSIHITTYHL
nr:hypothetical protein Q903MT_gene2238 [Picea sitchensis]